MKKEIESQILFVVGPTASGKSSLAMDLARRIGGEIICADSQTIRRGLDIGTAKPSRKDQNDIPHHLLDIIEPYDPFSVNQFKALATDAIRVIQKRGKIPIIVGGTGLYIDSLYFDYDVEESTGNGLYKKELEELSIDELQEIINIRKFEMPTNKNNPRHLIGTILRQGKVNQNNEPIKNAYIFGLMPSDDVLKNRINQRIDQMFADGFVDEVRSVIEKYGRPKTKMDAIGYPIIIDFIDGKISIDKAKDLFMSGHWQYTRRQKSWFKRNPNILWLNNNESALQEIIKEVNLT